MEVDVAYSGTPTVGGFGYFVFGSRESGLFAWSLSEPYGAREWWPCKDHPGDKADAVRVTVTVPSQYRVGSQGVLVSETVNGSDTDAVAEVLELTGGGVHKSFEAVGLKQTAEQSFQMLRNGGTATVIGMIPVGTHVELHGVDFLYEKKMQGSSMGSYRFRVDMARYVEFYLNRKLDLDTMVSQRIALGAVNDAFAALEKGDVARSVIVFDQ